MDTLAEGSHMEPNLKNHERPDLYEGNKTSVEKDSSIC